MISDSPTTTTPGALRLTMRPAAAPDSLVAGAWWPWSTDPDAEFPALIAAMAPRGAVCRISYHLGTWDRTARRMAVGDVVVRMEGFRAMQPDTVTLIGPDRTRTELLVVPPDTPADAARAVLRATATSSATATVEEILSENGVAPGANPDHSVTMPKAR